MGFQCKHFVHISQLVHVEQCPISLQAANDLVYHKRTDKTSRICCRLLNKNIVKTYKDIRYDTILLLVRQILFNW